MNYSLCITTYNRYELLLESFAEIIDDTRVDEIIILDDCSNDGSWDKIKDLPKYNSKIKVFRQATNRGMGRNKADSISYAENPWVILLDSDNIIKPDYLDAIPFILNPNTIYCPSFAWPNFNYSKFIGVKISRETIKNLINQTMFEPLLNTCNYVVNKDSYLDIYEHNDMMKATDTAWFNYLWLKNGGQLQVMKDCTYFHRLHDGSGFMQDVNYNMQQAEKIKSLLLAL